MKNKTRIPLLEPDLGENELKYLNLIKDLDPNRTDIAVEFIEQNTKLLDLKDKFNTLLIIKEKEDKIKRISYLP